MDKPPPCKIYFFSILLSAFVFASCAEDSIAIVSADAKIVFDYAEDSSPSQRLCVFVRLSSNVRRIENIDVRFSDGSETYSWKMENPVLMQSGKEAWAGYSHLERPSNLKNFPKGTYDFECVDSTGESARGNFLVEYDEKSFGEFSREKFSGNGWSERIAVYSEIGELLHFSEDENDKSDEAIFRETKDSSFLRHLYQAENVICLGPKIFKEGVDENGQ